MGHFVLVIVSCQCHLPSIAKIEPGAELFQLLFFSTIPVISEGYVQGIGMFHVQLSTTIEFQKQYDMCI